MQSPYQNKPLAEFLRSKGLLLKSASIPLEGDPERAIFMAVYSKSFFKDIDEFAVFVWAVSSITQMWYETGNLESALEFYYPDESGNSALQFMTAAQGTFSGWLHCNALEVRLQNLPFDFEGQLWLSGDREEFHILGEQESYLFEAFSADVVY